MESYHDIVVQLIQYFQQRISLYVVIIVAFSYHILFEKDLPCTCNGLSGDCAFYIILPIGIILVAQLWMDRAFQRACRSRKRGYCVYFCSCSCFLFSRFCSAIFVSFIWPISVLIDGDWTVCCFDYTNISCTNHRQRTDNETKALKYIRDVSRVSGLFLLLGLLFCAFIASCIHNNNKHVRKQAQDWHEIILEEEEKLVSGELRKKAKEELQIKLSKLIEKRDWAKCFTVGDEIISSSPSQSPPSGTPAEPTSGTTSGTPAEPTSGTTSGTPEEPTSGTTSGTPLEPTSGTPLEPTSGTPPEPTSGTTSGTPPDNLMPPLVGL